MKAAKLTRILVGYLKKFDIFNKETMQSFRSGGAICAILEGESLEEVMYRAYWKSPKTAVYYTKVLEVMCPRGFSWEKMGVDVKNTDYNKLDAMPALFKEDFWRAFKTQQSEKIAGRRVCNSNFTLQVLTKHLYNVLLTGKKEFFAPKTASTGKRSRV